MYGCTALPWIGPGRTSATWTVRSSRFSGRVRRSDCICARLSIWKQPTVSAFWISSNTAGSSSGMRERSICRPRVRAIRSTHSSTAESMPSPSRSILRKPASAHESLSHWHICRPAIADGCTGTSSTSGRVEMTIPPGCCEMWRGRPAISEHSSAKARQRGEASFCAASGSSATSSATRAAFQPSESFASRSSSANGRPSALPTSRIAPRERYVAKVATSAACSRPYFSVTRTISCSRMSRGKSRSMSGTDESSRLRKRPSESLAATGSTCDSPVR